MENRKNGGKLKERKKTIRPTIFLPFFYYRRKKIFPLHCNTISLFLHPLLIE